MKKFELRLKHTVRAVKLNARMMRCPMKRLLMSLLILPLFGLRVYAGPLQDLINAAQPGDIVTVPAGTYAEPVNIKEGVLLISEKGPDETIIDGQTAPFAVTFGKDAALIGFTVRGGQTALYNIGNFIGVFECIVTNFGQMGISIEKGSAAIMNTLVSGGTNTTGINCIEANPYVGFNIIENNHTGFNVSRWLIPTLDHNIFRNNQIGITSGDGTDVVMNGNVFDGNGQNAVGVKLGTNDEIRAATAEELKLRRGMSAESYRALMKKVFEESAAAAPRIMYDLTDELGKFNLIVTYPYATFSVSASARDTIIRAYDAYDRSNDAALNAQYCVANGGFPTVAVINPQITEKAFDRFVLEKVFEHPASYSVTPEGKRVFDRLTNLTRIEVILPAGWSMEQANKGATAEMRNGRQVVKMTSMGMTTVHVVLARQPPVP
jgi:hypothetical protein